MAADADDVSVKHGRRAARAIIKAARVAAGGPSRRMRREPGFGGRAPYTRLTEYR